MKLEAQPSLADQADLLERNRLDEQRGRRKHLHAADLLADRLIELAANPDLPTDEVGACFTALDRLRRADLRADRIAASLESGRLREETRLRCVELKIAARRELTDLRHNQRREIVAMQIAARRELVVIRENARLQIARDALAARREIADARNQVRLAIADRRIAAYRETAEAAATARRKAADRAAAVRLDAADRRAAAARDAAKEQVAARIQVAELRARAQSDLADRRIAAQFTIIDKLIAGRAEEARLRAGRKKGRGYDPSAPWGRKDDGTPYTHDEFMVHLRRAVRDIYGCGLPGDPMPEDEPEIPQHAGAVPSPAAPGSAMSDAEIYDSFASMLHDADSTDDPPAPPMPPPSRPP